MDTDSSFENFIASDDALFHYTKTSTALERILHDGKLKLSLLKDTNDPREYKKKVLFFWENDTAPDEAKDVRKKAYSVFNCILQHQYRVVCFCTNALPEIFLEKGGKVVDQYASNSGWKKSRMWSQYGENHHGICLVFSRDAILKHINGLSRTVAWQASGYVMYSRDEDIPPAATNVDVDNLMREGIDKHCTDHIHEHYQALFLIKHVDYRDEAEYRFIVNDPHNKHEFIDITNSLRGIIAGDRTPEVYFPLIKELSNKYKAICRCAYWDRGKAHLLSIR